MRYDVRELTLNPVPTSFRLCRHPSSRSLSGTTRASERESRRDLESYPARLTYFVFGYSDTELPFLFCSALLREQDGVSTVETIQPPAERRPAADAAAAATANDNEAEEEWSALVGQLVRNPRRIEDLDGVQRSVFVFEDVSVRTQGTYRLEFMPGEA